MTVNILGTEYKFGNDDLNNPDLAENDGFCRIVDKEIVIRERKYMAGISEEAKKQRERHVLRHELVHAFAEESGVAYGENEELVDWIANMIPKLQKVYEEIEKELGD